MTLYFEEVITLAPDGEAIRCVGTRPVPEPADRPLGYAGRRVVTLTASIELVRGYKPVRVSASERKPVTVLTMVHAWEKKG